MLRLALVVQRDARIRYQRAAARMREIELVQVVSDDGAGAVHGLSPSEKEKSEPSFSDWLPRHVDEIDAVLFHADSPVFEFDAECVLAAKAGKHVFCDGPLPLESERSMRLVEACRAAGVCLSVGKGARHQPALQTIKSSLDAGQLGIPGLVRIHRWQPRPRLSHSASGMRAVPPLIAELVAEIDLAIWLFGCKPMLVYAARANGAKDGDPSTVPGDFCQIHLGFSEGGMALIDLASTLPEGDSYFSLSLIGSAGAAYADDHHDRQLLFGGGSATAPGYSASETTLTARLRDFASAIEKNRSPLSSPEAMLAALEVTNAAVRSLSTGRPVPMTETV